MVKKTKTLAELAAMVGGELDSDPDVPIHCLADLASAGPGELAFLVKSAKYRIA